MIRFALPPCIIHKLTGYYCPGCGATRSTIALLHGDFATSLFYYPAIPVAAVLFLWFAVSFVAEKATGRRVFFHFPLRTAWLFLLLAIIVGNFIWKNAVLYFTGVALIP